MHGTHTGIQRFLRREWETVHRPEWSFDLNDHNSKCDIRSFYSSEQRNFSSVMRLLDRLWQKIGAHVFALDGTCVWLTTVQVIENRFAKGIAKILHKQPSIESQIGQLISDNSLVLGICAMRRVWSHHMLTWLCPQEWQGWKCHHWRQQNPSRSK